MIFCSATVDAGANLKKIPRQLRDEVLIGADHRARDRPHAS